MTARKPHNDNAGYVCELRCKLGGHIVIYDRERGFECDADQRWIVMHEPSSRHIAVSSLSHARSVMKGVARARTVDEAREHADILPTVEDAAEHEEPVITKQERDAALARFHADPENEPSAEGKAALRAAFRLPGEAA